METSAPVVANGGPVKPEVMSDEQVEMEQVPLKSDTDKPAEEETQPQAENEAPETEAKTDETAEKKQKTPSKFLGFFHRDKKPKDKDETPVEAETKVTQTETTKETAEIIPKEKKPLFGGMFCKKKCAKDGADAKEVEGDAASMTIGLNMLDRDEQGINEHVKLAFEDVFGEPDSYYHSWECVWRTNYRVFMCTRSFCYRLLALICVIPCALLWGILFALLTVANIWACVPLGRALTIPGTWIAKVWNFIVRSLFDPCFRSCGLCMSSITVRRYGISNDPTVDMA